MDLEVEKRMRRFFFSKKNCGLRKTRAGGPSNYRNQIGVALQPVFLAVVIQSLGILSSMYKNLQNKFDITTHSFPCMYRWNKPMHPKHPSKIDYLLS